MKKIIIASRNPVKINATLEGFKKMFPGEVFEIEGVVVPSGVKDQPMTDTETYQGALNRANNAQETMPGADFYVGMEGGLEEKNGEMEAFAWMVVKSADGHLGKGRTGTFFLCDKVAALIREGKELGEADDIIFNKTNSKQDNGAVGILTDNALTRTDYYVEGVVFALIPFKNSQLYL